ncbi:hypothetical protein ACXX9E_29610 [Pseudomonas sp. GNP014]
MRIAFVAVMVIIAMTVADRRPRHGGLPAGDRVAARRAVSRSCAPGVTVLLGWRGQGGAPFWLLADLFMSIATEAAPAPPGHRPAQPAVIKLE